MRWYLIIYYFFVFLFYANYGFADVAGFPNNIESSDLYNQLQVLQNRVDQLTNQVEQLQHALEKQQVFLEHVNNSVSASKQYNIAMKSMLQSHYKEAAKQFQAFILLYPKSKKNSEAYYWLGEINRKIGHDIAASKAYLTGAQKYPKGEKAAESLFKATNALIRVKQKKQACEIGNYLIKHYSNKKNKEFIKKEKIILRHAKCR